MTPVLIIVRHAHRDKAEGREQDNGLSAKGLKQAARVLERFQAELGAGAKPRLLSSPKKRCVETVQPIASATGVKLQLSPLLDEGADLETRARRFFAEWKKDAPALTVICSHGDWIPYFLEFATGVPTDLS